MIPSLTGGGGVSSSTSSGANSSSQANSSNGGLQVGDFLANGSKTSNSTIMIVGVVLLICGAFVLRNKF